MCADSSKPKEQERIQCVKTIQETHQFLRTECDDQEFDYVWNNHLKNTKRLNNYASAMQILANEYWDVEGTGIDRTKWCIETARQYFHSNGLAQCILKDQRRQQFYKENKSQFHCGPSPRKENTNVNFEHMPEELGMELLSLLDVGSCFNPFSAFEDFTTVAIDLCPSNSDVFKGDFLTINVVNDKQSRDNFLQLIESQKTESGPCVKKRRTMTSLQENPDLKTIPSNYFHVVVFSLLLTYIPCANARWKLCKKSHQVLKTNGLLLIVTPDSCHQNKHAARMKQWKMSIESIGFQRVAYKKSLHLHHMAFRKVPENFLWDKRRYLGWDTAPQVLPIQQDLSNESKKS